MRGWPSGASEPLSAACSGHVQPLLMNSLCFTNGRARTLILRVLHGEWLVVSTIILDNYIYHEKLILEGSMMHAFLPPTGAKLLLIFHSIVVTREPIYICAPLLVVAWTHGVSRPVVTPAGTAAESRGIVGAIVTVARSKPVGTWVTFAEARCLPGCGELGEPLWQGLEQ